MGAGLSPLDRKAVKAMEYCVNLLVSVPIEAVEDATIEELVYQAGKMLGKEVERLATASIYKDGEVKPIYEG